ncbi:MAG: hypothetical protein ACD_22C00098G0001 [uncultured bacterium]|nr:MAG: hypothetical protein ACD_22C00098G0001 [uncultured bacterium]
MRLADKIKLYIRYLLRNVKNDSIEFKVNEDMDYSEDKGGIPWLHTDLIVNSISLFEKLHEYERSEATRTKTNDDLAGKYIGIDPQSLVKIFKSGSTYNLSVWQCSICRSSLCASDLVCKYRITPLTVEFYDFRQRSNPAPFSNLELHNATIEKSKWNYSAFGPFRFNRQSFFKELSKI